MLPAAPLLVDGVTATWPPGVAKVRRHVDAALGSLPPADTVVLLAGGPHGRVYGGGAAVASLAGLGHADVARTLPVHEGAAAVAAAATRWPLAPVGTGGVLPVDLAALGLHVGARAPVVPVDVPAADGFARLASAGEALARGLAAARIATVVVAAGDLSAALTERSPRYRVPGADAWDARVVSVADTGRLHGLARLGPEEAARVAARGWAPLAVLHGVCAASKVGIVLRHYSAPRGVGYLVAAGA